MAFSWTLTSALSSLDNLIAESHRVRNSGRNSAQHARWQANVLSCLEDVFGRDSHYYNTFVHYTWAANGFMIDPCELQYDVPLQDVIDRKHHEGFVRQLEHAKGILQAAHDELNRKGLECVYRGKNTGPEASDILEVIDIVERKLRKAVRSAPRDEKDVQDHVEVLLIGRGIPYSRERDRIEYSSKTYIPDFTMPRLDLALEVKLCNTPSREKQFIAEINDDILAYKTKYGNVIFVVYDCGHIVDVDRFQTSFEGNAGVRVCVVKH